jgi:hypothetical protein
MSKTMQVTVGRHVRRARSSSFAGADYPRENPDLEDLLTDADRWTTYRRDIPARP